MTDWNALLETVVTDEVASHGPAAPVDVPGPLVELLTKLRAGSVNGKKLRAKLDVKTQEEYQTVRNTLRAAGGKLNPPASINAKPVYDEKDETTEQVDGKTVVKLREGAVPIAVSFTVGEKRGAKGSNPPAVQTADAETSVPVEPTPAKTARGGKR